VHPKRPDPNRTYPSVSLIVPARNEAVNIDACLAGAIAQDYPDLEIIFVDDRSTDDTAARIQSVAATDSRVHLLRGVPLPEGWAGKPWALHQGITASRGEWILHIDADTRLHPGAVTAVVDAARDGWSAVDDDPAPEGGFPVFSIMTGQSLPTWWEKILQPAVLGAIMEALPLRLVNSPRVPWIALANGQFILVRRDAYDRIGGYAAIRSEIAEDVMFARRAKRMGLRVRLAAGQSLATTRMYRTPADLWEGWTKNLHVGSRLMPGLVLPGLAYLATAVMAPWALLVGAWHTTDRHRATRMRAAAGALFAIAFAHRRGIDHTLGVPVPYAFTQPIGVLATVGMMAASQFRVRSGRGVTWKGRRYAG
jgi:chlorobactene glucosyltransferase